MNSSRRVGYKCSLFHIHVTYMYRDALKGGPVLLSNSQTGPGTNFSQPRAHLIMNLCACLRYNMYVTSHFYVPYKSAFTLCSGKDVVAPTSLHLIYYAASTRSDTQSAL